MNLYSISISHKTAPIDVRESFSIHEEEKKHFIRLMMQSEHITEVVFISTCNRSEVYFCGDNQAIEQAEELLAAFKNVEITILRKYFLRYHNENSIRHLLQVTTGMDSMVLGEDEILGQVKAAYELSLHENATGYLLNKVFKAAITCAKKIKTDTKLSKTPVSIGTLVANIISQFAKEPKKILIIGLSGKMGTIVMKNIYHNPNVMILGTSRKHKTEQLIEKSYEKVEVMDYMDRYSYMDEADIVISATTSPHYTVTYKELKDSLKTRKHRLFIDLAVPMDIDRDIIKLRQITLYDIDYFKTVADKNLDIKYKEVEKANLLLEEQLDELWKELLFRDFLKELPKVKKIFTEQKFETILYEIRDIASKDEFTTLLNTLKKLV